MPPARHRLAFHAASTCPPVNPQRPPAELQRFHRGATCPSHGIGTPVERIASPVAGCCNAASSTRKRP
jgi:hypothetical protein